MEISEPIIAAGTVLTGAIGVLWRMVVAHHKDTKAKLEKCEEGHVDTNGKLLEMSQQVGRLEGRQVGIEQLSRTVLNQIHESVQQGDEKTADRINRIHESGLNTGHDHGLLGSSGNLGAGNPQAGA